MAYPNDQDRRRYEDAILAALDFQPTLDPAMLKDRHRSRQRVLRLVALAVAHFGFAVVFAAALAAGHTGWPLVVAALAWLGGTVLIVGTTLRAARRRVVARPRRQNRS